MFLDFHTHQIAKMPGVQNIYNVILNDEAIHDEGWKKREAVSIGIHPWYIPAGHLEEALSFLQEAAALPVVKCIGEAGLDTLRGNDVTLQKAVFIHQIRVAQFVNKPVVIHCVRAFTELMAIKKEVRPSVPMIIHGFNRKPELAQKLLSAGFYLSFGKDILQKPPVQEALRQTPAGRLFLETDDCTEVSIQTIYEKAAAIRGVSVDELQQEIDYTALKLNIK